MRPSQIRAIINTVSTRPIRPTLVTAARARPAQHLPQLTFRRSLFVQTESTPNVDSLKFLPGKPLGNATYEFLSPSAALSSPLAASLFDIEGVSSIFFGPDFITVNKNPDASWANMKPEIYSTIIEHFTSGQSLFKDPKADEDGPEDTRILDSDSETLAMIKELLDTRVRPAIQEDGGDLEFKGFDENTGIVTLSLKGSCRGCDSSTVTLKNGIERMLMHYVPEVKSVEQVMSETEEIALDEFAKFEQRLHANQRRAIPQLSPSAIVSNLWKGVKQKLWSSEQRA